jgi:hypothetical protein
MIRRIETASEAGWSGRASTVWRSPSSSRDHNVNAADVWRRWRGLSREVSTGVLDALSVLVRGVVDGGGLEAVARRGEVSRGRSTGGIGGRWEGPNAKPSVRTFVLVVVALTVANPRCGGLGGRAGG